MGNACAGRPEKVVPKDYESPENHVSKLDDEFERFERDLGFLKKIDIHTWIEYVSSIKDHSHILEELDKIKFEAFVQNKIISNPIIVSEIEGNKEKGDQLKTFLQSLFSRVLKSVKEYHSLKGRKHNETLSRHHLILIGFLFSNSTIRSKVDILFSLFSKSGKAVHSESLHEFIYVLFSLHSKALLFSLQDHYGDGLKVDGEDFINHYSKENIQKLTDMTLLSFFGGDLKNQLIRDEFDKNFATKNENYVWIFIGSGIRSNLEKPTGEKNE